MANPPPRSGSSKDKDDDSWGKLASDLLGIQFGGVDDDFDLPDEDAPTAKAVESPKAPEPMVSRLESASIPGRSEPEPDLSFPEDEDESAAERQPTAETEPADSRGEVEKEDIWDLLESWNWDEPSKEPARPRSDVSQGRREGRSGRDSGSPRRDRGGRPERSRDRDEDRPPRRHEVEVAAGDEPARETRPPRRDEGARREGAARRSESREETPRRDQAPRSEQRPAQRAERMEERPPRSRSPQPGRSTAEADEFAEGLSDEMNSRPKATAATKPAEPRAASSTKRPAPPVRRPEEADDFAGNLFQEDDSVDEEMDDEERAESGAGEGEEESLGEDRPRRRRRRRRRVSRGRRPEMARSETDSEEIDEDRDELGADEDDLTSGSIEDEEAVEARGDEDEEGDTAEDREVKRRRRRRRRGRRRPEETSTRDDAFSVEERMDESVDSEREIEVGDEPLEEEAVVPVSYEGIPSWEEAISYLLRSRGPEPRGRSDSSSRGRGGSQHRR